MALYTHTPVPGVETLSIPRESWRALHRLLDELSAGESSLNHVAEQVQNPGTKLLLKALAQQRAGDAVTLRSALGEVSDGVDGGPMPPGEVRHGMTDIAAAMTLGRENRQHTALRDYLKDEQRLVDAYEEALSQPGLPEGLTDLLSTQRTHAALTLARLRALDADGQTNLVVRLFGRIGDAERAVAGLASAGFSPHDYQAYTVDQLPVHQETVRRRSTSQRSSTVAGAVAGGVVGLLVGIAVGLYQMLMPAAALTISVDAVTMAVVSTVAGALMGAVFGYIIGRNQVEDDEFVYSEGLERGQRLVVVYADAARKAEAERILRVHHERELGPE
jgi:hypothetical protein